MLKDFYKKNPFAEKLSDKNSFYRAVNSDAFQDYIKNKTVRGNPEGVSVGPQVSKTLDLSRKTPFPAFQKGKVLEGYLPKDSKGYIFESKRPMVGRGEVNPVTKKTQLGGGHFAHRPFDPFTGKTVPEISAAEVRAFEGKPNWLMGYKEVGKGYPAVQAAKETAKRLAKGVAKGGASGLASGAASAAIEPIAEAAMKEYEKRIGASAPDPKSTAGRLRRLAIRGGPLGAPYDLAESAAEFATDVIPNAVNLAYDTLIDAPAREKRIRKAAESRKKEQAKKVKNLPKISEQKPSKPTKDPMEDMMKSIMNDPLGMKNNKDPNATAANAAGSVYFVDDSGRVRSNFNK